MDEVIKQMKNKEKYSVEDLRKIVEILRSENGCPWDKVQTHKSIRQDLLEEAYEAVEAIDMESDEMLCEELGDVMLQVVFHSSIAEGEGRFTIEDVCTGVCRKLIERHPHVFGEIKVETVDDVLTNWDRIKQNSKKRNTLKEQFDGVCKALPALMLANKYVHKANKNNIEIKTKTQIEGLNEEKAGDLMFDIVVLCEKNNIDPESALREKCKRFLCDVT